MDVKIIVLFKYFSQIFVFGLPLQRKDIKIMSKTTTGNNDTSYPSYTSTSVSFNGVPKSGAAISDGVLYANYNMGASEKDAYDYAQSEFANNLKNLNVFSESTLKDLNDQVEAYKNQGFKTINDLYTPLIRDLQNDVASRFGNLDNSVFLDKLSGLESHRADSISSLARDVEARKQDLVTNELAGRYAYLDLLNNYQNQVYQNAISTVGLNNNLLGTANSYLNNYYSANNRNSNANSNLQNQLSQIALLLAKSGMI